MNATVKVTLLKTVFILFYFLFVLTAINAWATGKKRNNKGCGDSPFKTEIVSFDKDESCYEVEMEISYSDNVRYELSHANIDFGCGTISNEWNSMGWKMEANHQDPTTGIGGIKIDDIQNFGKDPNQPSFTVKFTYCPDHECVDEGFSPRLAYKAGQCIYYEKPNNHYVGDETGEVNDENDDGGDDGSDSGESGECNNGTTDPGQNDSDSGSNENPDNSTNDPTILTVSIEKIDPGCKLNDGHIFLKATGGTEPFDVTWNTGETGLYLTDKPAGTYTFTLFDAVGKEASGEVVLEDSDAITIDETIKNPDCTGINNGSIELSISGGTEPYTISWSNGSNLQNQSELFAGNYSATITDTKGCVQTKSISLYNTNAIQVGAQIVQPSCQEGTTGSVDLTVSGGTEPYMIGWNTGDVGNYITGLTDGFYKTTITDLNGCTFSDTYAIETNMGITATAIITRPNCFDDPTGAIDLTVSGGTEPYSVEWSNGATSEDISGLTSGNYTATITDAKGCSTQYKASVLQDKININYQGLTVPSCHGFDNGEIKISITNGTEPYDIQWSNGATTEDISNLTKGTYSVLVTDAEGCTSERSFMLPEPNPVQINHEVAANNCTGSQNIIINPSGGSLEYFYLWSDGSTSKDKQDVLPGTHEVVVTDTRGCTASKTILVAQQPIQTADCLIANPATDVACGSADNILTGDIANAISYQWSVASTDGSWAITSAPNQGDITYTAGNSSSIAIFKLTVAFEGGCEISCEKVIETCTSSETPTEDPTTDPDNPNPDEDNLPSDDNTCDTSGENEEDNTSGNEQDNDGETEGDKVDDNETDDDQADNNSNDDNTPDEPADAESSADDEEESSEDNDDPVAENDWNKDKDCDECFYTDPVTFTKSDAGYIYEIVVNHKDCRYDLSHMTIEIPDCYDIVRYNNSMNWKMEVTTKDPTTGLSGIKVDDIPSFGKDANSSFTIKLELTSDDPDCKEEMKCFAPIIAYKASTCVYEEVTNSQCYEEDDNYAHEISTFPNPTCDYVKVDLRKCDKESSYIAKLINFRGELVRSYSIDRKFKDEFIVNLSSKKHGLYLLQMKSSKGICTTHRIVKK